MLGRVLHEEPLLGLSRVLCPNGFGSECRESRILQQLDEPDVSVDKSFNWFMALALGASS